MKPFKVAHATADNWAQATQACTDIVADLADDATLGFVYVTDVFAEDLAAILTYLRQKTGVGHWVGTVGIGICAGGREYFDQPAVAIMLASLDEDDFRLFPSIKQGASQLSQDTRQWIASTSPMIGLVHADPAHEELSELIDDLATDTSTFLVGGLTSSRDAHHQIANRITGGGVSGVFFSPRIEVATGLSQGCLPIAQSHEISDCVDNVVIGLDGRRALDVLKEDIGADMGADWTGDMSQIGGVIHAALPIHGSDTGDYLVRNLIGIDPERGWLAIAEQIEPGERIIFVRRDAESAAQDLTRMLGRLKARLGRPPRGGVYVSCVARGPNMFGDAGGEMAMIQNALGDFPLIGFYAGGEISFNRLYTYTGVLTLFL
ncbi:MAG: FIST C-terminal domain-containing protein [Rhodospirillales bacterium]|nr:FIST C-terminal domain-containing protein [Rhodospirillales bacterium]